MTNRTRRLLALVALLAILFSWVALRGAPAEPGPSPVPAIVGASVGGRTSPSGTEIQIDLPGDLHRRNTASKGLGNCVFTSIHHAAVWQDVPALQEFPKWLIAKGIPGGGYPGKVDKLIQQISKDRGLPVPEYVQIKGADWQALQLATRTGRMICCTYSRSPTGRYGGSRIVHMVNAPHCTAADVAILDNNYPGSDKYEWLTPAEAKRAGCLEWCVILLEPGPPPVPKN